MPGAFPTVTGRALPIAERDTDGTALRSSGNHRQRSIWRHLGRRSYRRHRIGPGFRMDGRRPCSFGARSVRERPTSGSTAWTPMRIGPPGVDSMEPSLYAHLFAATQVLVLVWIGFEARARGKSPWRIVPLVASCRGRWASSRGSTSAPTSAEVPGTPPGARAPAPDRVGDWVLEALVRCRIRQTGGPISMSGSCGCGGHSPGRDEGAEPCAKLLVFAAQVRP